MREQMAFTHKPLSQAMTSYNVPTEAGEQHNQLRWNHHDYKDESDLRSGAAYRNMKSIATSICFLSDFLHREKIGFPGYEV